MNEHKQDFICTGCGKIIDHYDERCYQIVGDKICKGSYLPIGSMTKYFRATFNNNVNSNNWVKVYPFKEFEHNTIQRIKNELAEFNNQYHTGHTLIKLELVELQEVVTFTYHS